jgi:NAD-dependent dihydropyrimidine dehydrogenase PreA subunit/flavodoxin
MRDIKVRVSQNRRIDEDAKMNIKSAGLIYFSPTQTTRKVVEGILQGLQVAKLHHIDLTPSDAETQKLSECIGDLALIGSPVYAGRLPAVMLSRFRRLKGNGTPAVIVVVYGNRAYEDALLELRDIALEAGFKPVAAGAFIGEHSYSSNEVPIVAGRPDAEDLGKAEGFGKMIREKMAKIRTIDQINPLQVPGNFPYKELKMLSGIAPAIDETICTTCKMCISACPTAAIHADNPALTDKDSCIRCCACVKICPACARTLDDPRIKQLAEQLNMNCSNPKEPELYL